MNRLPAKKKSENLELSYEEGIAQLEAQVERMEEGELSLEETLAAYERGVALHARLDALLKRGEKRVEMLALQDKSESTLENEPERISFALEEG